METTCVTHGDALQLECECGQPLQIADLTSSLCAFPEPDLLQTVTKIARWYDPSFSGSFAIRGTTLRFVPLPKPDALQRLSLDELRAWRVGGRLQYRTVDESRTKALTAILRKSKEKCRRGGSRPTKDKCQECLAVLPDPGAVRRGDVCLLRLFGVPIGQKFNGIHHGHELADIQYSDIIESRDLPVRIGIHVKSRVARIPPRGLGRSKSCIKGLYTQLIFSAYKVLADTHSLDVLGVAVPNRILGEVLDSMQVAVNALGFPLLVIEEDDWLRVLDAAMDQL